MKNKIKICIVNIYGYGLYNDQCSVPYAGSEVQLFLLSKKIASNKDLSVIVITGDYLPKNKKMIKVNDLLLDIRLTINRNFFKSIVRMVILLLELVKLKPDIVIQRSLRDSTGICFLYSIIFRKKFIFCIAHDNDILKKGKKGIVSYLFKFGLINPNCIVAQTRYQVFNLTKLRKINFNNIRLIKSGYEIGNFEELKKNYILWVGRDAKWKRAELFVTLARNKLDIPFMMIMRKIKNPEYWNIIFHSTKSVKNLHFKEFVPFNRINDYFNRALIFVNTSEKEGFPNTFIQALKSGTPILSLNVDPDNILKKHKLGFCCENNFLKMNKYIDQLLEDKVLYNYFSKNALNYVRENHDLDKIYIKWLGLIEKLI